jgi:hypothetical protein
LRTDNGGTSPGKSNTFTRPSILFRPLAPANDGKMVEPPGTAPGSGPLIPCAFIAIVPEETTVMAPVDGGYTLDRATMVRVLTRLRSSLILPMHWFGQSNLDAFLADMEAHFTVVDRGDSAIEVSLRSLPATPTVWLLRPRYLHDDR